MRVDVFSELGAYRSKSFWQADVGDDGDNLRTRRLRTGMRVDVFSELVAYRSKASAKPTSETSETYGSPMLGDGPNDVSRYHFAPDQHGFASNELMFHGGCENWIGEILTFSLNSSGRATAACKFD